MHVMRYLHTYKLKTTCYFLFATSALVAAIFFLLLSATASSSSSGLDWIDSVRLSLVAVPPRQIDHDWLGAAAHEDPHDVLVRRVDLLVLCPRRDEGEVAGRELVALQVVLAAARVRHEHAPAGRGVYDGF